MPAATATPAKVVGRPFGRFELRRVLGEGAQATVWLGFDQRLEREVAIKQMHSHASVNPAAVGEWLREARSVSRLTHPNIVPVFEADVLEQASRTSSSSTCPGRRSRSSSRRAAPCRRTRRSASSSACSTRSRRRTRPASSTAT